MMLLWLVVVARCSGSDEIPLDRAEQSSIAYGNIAAKAIDGDLVTFSCTAKTDPAWWRVYFTSSSTVGKVVVEEGRNYAAACLYTVSVYDGEAGTVCGTYTGIPDRYNFLYFATLTLLFKTVIIIWLNRFKIKLRELTLTYRRFGSNFVKPISHYFNETVQCGGKMGDSVKIEKTGCGEFLQVMEMKVYRTALLAIGKGVARKQLNNINIIIDEP